MGGSQLVLPVQHSDCALTSWIPRTRHLEAHSHGRTPLTTPSQLHHNDHLLARSYQPQLILPRALAPTSQHSRSYVLTVASRYLPPITCSWSVVTSRCQIGTSVFAGHQEQLGTDAIVVIPCPNWLSDQQHKWWRSCCHRQLPFAILLKCVAVLILKSLYH